MTYPKQSQVDRHFCREVCTMWDKDKGCFARRTAKLMDRGEDDCAWELDKIEKERPGCVRRKQ